MRLMISLLVMLALVPAVGVAQEPPPIPQKPRLQETSCFDCHSQLDDVALEPTRHVDTDIHFRKGLACHDCHGGNPEAGFDGDPFAAHDEAMGFKGKPSRTKIPEFCGGCHADAAFMKKYNPKARVDQLSEYRTSVHGQKNAAGDENTAVCIDCHGAHGVRPISDPNSRVYPVNVADTCAQCHVNVEKMQPYLLSTNQVAEYKSSVHARAIYEKGDISAPTCNDCHGSHGAVPPGVESVANVCGSCHGRESTLFRETEEKKGLNLAACIQCMVCHSNHAVVRPTDDMLGVGSQSTCVGCHFTGDPGYAAAAEMADSIGALKSRLNEANELLERAERMGVEVSEDRFALQKAQDSLVEARVLAPHSFDLERFQAVAAEGMGSAEEGVAAGYRAFDELRTRRVGLALSLVVIILVIVALGLKIRAIERPVSSDV